MTTVASSGLRARANGSPDPSLPSPASSPLPLGPTTPTPFSKVSPPQGPADRKPEEKKSSSQARLAGSDLQAPSAKRLCRLRPLAERASCPLADLIPPPGMPAEKVKNLEKMALEKDAFLEWYDSVESVSSLHDPPLPKNQSGEGPPGDLGREAWKDEANAY